MKSLNDYHPAVFGATPNTPRLGVAAQVGITGLPGSGVGSGVGSSLETRLIFGVAASSSLASS